MISVITSKEDRLLKGREWVELYQEVDLIILVFIGL